MVNDLVHPISELSKESDRYNRLIRTEEQIEKLGVCVADGRRIG